MEWILVKLAENGGKIIFSVLIAYLSNMLKDDFVASIEKEYTDRRNERSEPGKTEFYA